MPLRNYKNTKTKQRHKMNNIENNNNLFLTNNI